MSANTKIIVLKSKELIYTGIFILLGALLILLLFYMFSGNKTNDNSSEQTSDITADDSSTSTMVHYAPGEYASNVNLAGSNLHMTVTVDADHITHVALDNLDETTTTMYPLLSPSLDAINANLPYTQSIDDITFSSDNEYTTLLLVDAIKTAVEPAIIK